MRQTKIAYASQEHHEGAAHATLSNANAGHVLVGRGTCNVGRLTQLREASRPERRRIADGGLRIDEYGLPSEEDYEETGRDATGGAQAQARGRRSRGEEAHRRRTGHRTEGSGVDEGEEDEDEQRSRGAAAAEQRKGREGKSVSEERQRK